MQEIAFELKDDETMIEMQSVGELVLAASTKRVYMLEYLQSGKAVMKPIPFLYEDE